LGIGNKEALAGVHAHEENPQSLENPMRKLMLSLAAAALIAGCASMASTPVKTANGMLTGPHGMTLYTFDKDAAGSGKSVCNGPCATLWPPLFASGADKQSGGYTVIVRDDGKKQWAYKGKPLYYFARDTKAGEVTGNGFNKVWTTARP
jgi:predicted lipoprotein with Yx(FWY)xxD motif